MRYTILGFSQRRLVELGLSMDEALVLRWFVDYQATGRMRQVVLDGEVWFWVNFAGVLEDIPIAGGSPKTISRRFDRLQDSGILERRTFKEGGVFSCYRLCPDAYKAVIDDGFDPCQPRLEPIEPEESIENEGRTKQVGGWTNLSDGTPTGVGGRTKVSEGWTNLSEQKISVLETREDPLCISPKVPKPSAKHKGTPSSGVPVIPDGIQGPLREALVRFAQFRKDIRAPMTDAAMRLALNRLTGELDTDEERIRCIDTSIESGYRGLFPERIKSNKRRPVEGQPSQRGLGTEAAWDDYLKGGTR